MLKKISIAVLMALALVACKPENTQEEHVDQPAPVADASLTDFTTERDSLLAQIDENCGADEKARAKLGEWYSEVDATGDEFNIDRQREANQKLRDINQECVTELGEEVADQK